jgi:hypothetical protein
VKYFLFWIHSVVFAVSPLHHTTACLYAHYLAFFFFLTPLYHSPRNSCKLWLAEMG